MRTSNQDKENTDAALVARVRRGDKEAFGDIVNRYYAALLGVGRSYSRARYDADDAVQNAFLLAYLHLHQLKDPAKLGSWLRRLTIYAALKQNFKNTAVLLDALPEIQSEPQSDPTKAVDTRLMLHQMLACLSPETRLTVTLYYQKQFSLEEIAAFQEVPATTIKSRLRNARARLRKEMEPFMETTVTREMRPALLAVPALLRRIETAGTVFQLAFSPDGSRLITVASLDVTPEKWDSLISCWESKTGRPLWSVSHASWVFSPVFLPDGQSVAVAAGMPKQRGGKTGLLLLLDAATGNTQKTIADVPAAKSLAISPDGCRAALGGTEEYEDYRSNGQQGIAVVYDLMSGKQVLKVAPHLNYVTALAFSPDGAILATSSHLRDADPESPSLWRGGDIRLWDAQTGALRFKLARTDRGTRHNLAFSPDGAALAAPNGWQGEVRVWDTVSGAEHFTLPGSGEPVFALAFSPDGKTLACGCGDNAVRLWSAEGGDLRQTITDFEYGVYALAFSPDGKTLVTSDKNGLVQVWRL